MEKKLTNTKKGNWRDGERVAERQRGRELRGGSENETCRTLKKNLKKDRPSVKTAEPGRKSLPAVACAHGKSFDLTIWVNPY